MDGIAHALRLRREPILPLAATSPRHRRRRGLGNVAADAADAAASYASRLGQTKITVPPVSFVQAASYVWIFLSLIVAVLGFASCTYVYAWVMEGRGRREGGEKLPCMILTRIHPTPHPQLVLPQHRTALHAHGLHL